MVKEVKEEAGTAEKGITVNELLKRTYERLTKDKEYKEMPFPKKVLSEIGNDSDWHRTKIGYMGYESVRLVEFGNRRLAIGRGERCGDYPAKPYDSDIIVLEVPAEWKEPEQVQEELTRAIRKGSYFTNTLILGGANGELGAIKRSKFGKMSEIASLIDGFVAQEPEYAAGLIDLSTGGPPCTKGVRYKSEFVDVLAQRIEEVLTETS